MPMLVKEPGEYPEPDEDDASREKLFPGKRNENALPSAPPQQRQCYFVLSLAKFVIEVVVNEVFADHVDICHIYAEIGNGERTEI